MQKSPTYITNPIIPGFYSDPSVCRDGDDYYLITSSFEFYPGVPVFHSRDLVNWTQISHCLNRPEQLPLENAGTSDGIYAPTIRKYQDTYYMITSNRCNPSGNHFIVTAKNPAGPWSTPIWIKDIDGNIPGGVDPSLFFDEDGTCYFSCVAWDELGQGIGQAVIDVETGRLLTPLQIVWHGTGGTFPEGPHTYKIHGYYFLMIAEGGTEFGHKVTIARAENISGPYISCPHNPVLTQIYQKAQSCAVQGIGHGDLFEAHDGTWWMIVHGFRPSIGKLHHLGRETMLVPVTWDKEGWPVANEKGYLDETISLSGTFSDIVQKNEYHTTDTFSNAELPLYWNYLRNAVPTNYQTAEGMSGLTLYGSSVTLDDIGSPTWIGRRQQHFNCKVTADLEFSPETGDEAGITVYQTNEHHYDLVITKSGGKRVAYLRKTVGDIHQDLPFAELSGTCFRLQICADKECYSFAIKDGETTHSLGTGRTQLISTEAMQYQNFTGTYFALYASSVNAVPAGARFTYFEYLPFVEKF